MSQSQRSAVLASKKELLAALAGVRDAATEQFGEPNPDRVAQLAAVLSTAEMAVEHLFTETPYRMGA
jgi:hypothetical protein